MVGIPSPRALLRFASPGHFDGRIRLSEVLYSCRVEEQAIRFTADAAGRRIAWARTGSGPPLVLSGWWTSHLELNWFDPRIRAFVERLGRHRTVIRFDPPGTGASADGELPAGDVDDEAAALAAVVEAAAEGPVDLAAGSSGAPIGIVYAIAHPERVRRLLIYGGYARGSQIADERSRQAIVALVREHWGLGSRALADIFIPGANGAEREEFVEFQRRCMDAERAARSLEAVYAIDIADRLGEAPPGAVVMHRREDRAIPFAQGRALAAGLPDATFVTLGGVDHFPWRGDSDQYFAAVFDALGVEEEQPPSPEPGAPQRDDTASTADPTSADPGDLTRRETEVLALVAAGLSDREIAERLVLSPHTVHRHVANVRTKLGLPTRAAAVAEAAKRGLL
ncbi:MAG: alpha/beta fold hydrolase [Actinobacteria bacterium]|nr:alpha/beta fold hydrolase [Actinomycetota bacterium]